MSQVVSPQVFANNIAKINQLWQQAPNLQSYDALCIANGKNLQLNPHTISITSWIFGGFNITETIVILLNTKIWIITSDRKIDFLSNLKKSEDSAKYQLCFISKKQSNQQSFDNIWKAMGSNSNKIGILDKDTLEQPLPQEFVKFVKSKNCQIIESYPFFSACLFQKRKDELQEIKNSSYAANHFMKKFISELQGFLETGVKIRHEQLAHKVEKYLNDGTELKKLQSKTNKIKANSFDRNYMDAGHLQVQSGSHFRPQPIVTCDSSFLNEDCIILGLGTIYKNYHCYLSRTFLINCTEEQESLYKKVLALHKLIIQSLGTEKKYKHVYDKASKFMKQNLPGIQIPKSFGYSSGAILQDEYHQIDSANNHDIIKGSSFLIVCNLPVLKYGGSKTFGIKLIDTVLVTSKGQQNLTESVGVLFKDISYQLDNTNQNTNIKIEQQSRDEGQARRPTTRRGKKHDITINNIKNIKALQEHQKQLKKLKLQQLKDRANQNFLGNIRNDKVECSKLLVYKSYDQIPKFIDKQQIHIDENRHAVILPINGKSVPFHIRLIKNVVKSNEGSMVSLRFNFHTINTNAGNLSFPKFNESKIFVKELVFRSLDKMRYIQIEKDIKNLQKKLKNQKQAKSNGDQAIQQDPLQLNKGKRPVLRDMFMRPQANQKKLKGVLECHLNGFRYLSNKNEAIDVIFSNIHYAFVQPCQKQIIAALHFRLHDPILVAKKKTLDVQFYTDCGVILEEIQGKRSKYHDEDDEEKMKQSRVKLDKELLHWVRNSEAFVKGQFQFEYPQKNKTFYGSPFVSTIPIQSTSSCLINIVESKFFIVPYEEIEITCFQRMYANTRYFDLIIIKKDFETSIKIGQISTTERDKIKKLLDSKGIIIYEQGRNLNWSKFLANVRKDFKKFVEDQAWMAWDQVDEEIEEQDFQNDESFQIEGSEFSESDEDDSESDYEQQGKENSESEEELSEEGLSSDQLEERAELEDLEQQRREIERRREKQKHKNTHRFKK